MASPVIAAFVVTFVGGPLLCALLLRLPATLGTLIALGLLVVVTSTGALTAEGRMPLASLLMMWLGWVAACAMVAHALRRRITALRPRRWITVIDSAGLDRQGRAARGGHALPDPGEKRPSVQTRNPPLDGDVC